MNRRFTTIANDLNRCAIGAGVFNRLTAADVEAAFNAGRWQCSECGRLYTDLYPLTAVHTFPLGISRVGKHTASNLRLICRDRCEAHKPAPVLLLSSYHRQRATVYLMAAA